MQKILISWIGITDIEASKQNTVAGDAIGPLAMTVSTIHFHRIYLLSSFDDNINALYTTWLKQFSPKTAINIKKTNISSPMNFEDIYSSTEALCKKVSNQYGSSADLSYNISPGTSAMAAVFILVAKTIYPGTIIQTSIEYGVKEAYIPFDISMDFIPKLLEAHDSRIVDTSLEEPAALSSFQSIIYRSREMAAVVKLAKKIAPHMIPVLIEGESGTGKELFARAIHNAGTNRNKPFIVVNCGAIPKELFESELFGHEKGSFTGAIAEKVGAFESASGGTVFLDEIGELPLQQQVKLLRVLQEKTIKRIGSNIEISITSRIIAATNKNLIREVQNGFFRNDLFYRIAAAVITLPPLRERQGDMSLLINHFMQIIESEYADISILSSEINNEGKSGLRYQKKGLTAEARQKLYSHTWPGNIRELINTLRRAYIWADSDIIQADDIYNSLIRRPESDSETYNASMTHVTSNMDYRTKIQDKSFSFEDELNNNARNWIQAALDISNDNKTKAAKLLKLNSYQTLNNWIKRVGLSD